MRTAVVVGAGLAGLSAALRLADAGVHVTVLEKAPDAGGRVRRLRAAPGRTAIDFGQHLMLGCYRQSRALAARLGTSALLEPVDAATPFVTGPGRLHPYRLGRLPAPLHALPALAGLTHLPVGARLGLGRVALAAKVALRLDPAGLDRLPADTWLRRNGQGQAALDGFWGPLVSATLNRPPSDASALLLATVLDRGFLGSREDAVPFLPVGLLDEVFVAPALAALRHAGGEVRTATRVDGLAAGPDGRVCAAVTSRGRVVPADAFVVAVPSWDVAGATTGLPGLEHLRGRAERLGASPIVTVEMWFQRSWMRPPFAALLGTSVQWIFRHRLVPGESGGAAQRVSAVISHADGLAGFPADRIAASCVAEVERFFPEAETAGLLHTQVVQAPRATFCAAPGQAALRPPARTRWSNLFLAGDWTATGLPATIEGAVASGVDAADLILG